ncbi:hypothetical protein F4808DRAFT_475120 [Astrocystis sublimbata]|nr:hypothetical protein F4808DRAFT_475120 [Astrocystis sublimbata]
MAESTSSKEGNDLHSHSDGLPKTSLPDPESNVQPSEPVLVRGSAPRAPRFSKLSDAYLKVTARQEPNSTLRNRSDQSDPSTTTPDLETSASLVPSPRLSKSQNDLKTSGSVTATPTSVKAERRTSLDPIALPANMGRKDDNQLGLGEEIEHELLRLKAQSNDATGSTIEGILAQYDMCSPSLKTEKKDSHEYCTNAGSFPSDPPRDSLPQLPSADMGPASLRQRGSEPSIPDSSITDSEHLLDAEAQAYELDEARRALIPSPLNIPQSRYELEIPLATDRKYCQDKSNVAVDEDNICTSLSTTNQASRDYNPYLQPFTERDISRDLRHLGGNAERSIGMFNSSDATGHVPPKTRPQGEIFSPTRLPKVSGGKPIRQIKVIIGQDSENDSDNEDDSDMTDLFPYDRREIPTAECDWVTETASEAGFEACSNESPEQDSVKRFNKAGSSLADYSDDGHESSMGGFGSRERIIPHPTSDGNEKPSGTPRLNAAKLAFLLPRQRNPFQKNANSLWENSAQQQAGHLPKQDLNQNTHPFRNISSRRLVFNFDQNAPPKYQFRDSVSDYEPAKASIKSNCGTNQYDTFGSLPSSGSSLKENHYEPTSSTHDDRAVDASGDRDGRKEIHCSTDYLQDNELSTYAADRQEQLEELEHQDFAAASSYHEPPSADTVRSKFNFELVPLDLIRNKAKGQRRGRDDHEMEPLTRNKLKHQQSSSLTTHPTGTIERPARAFITSRDLSLDFSTPNWRTHDQESEDTPFSMRHTDPITPNKTRYYQKENVLGSLEIGSPFGTPTIVRRSCQGQHERHYITPRNQHRYKLSPRLIAPDDYVSDRSNRIRRVFFYVITALSILPFIGVLALGGAFKEAFKWATWGEVDRLTARQRRVLKWILLVEAVAYTSTCVAVAVYFAMKSKAHD